MMTLLPYPDFHESASILADADLAQQVQDCGDLLDILLEVTQCDSRDKATIATASLWKGCEMQLAEFGLQCAEELSRRGQSTLTAHLSWALEMAAENPNMCKPDWFGNVEIHEAYRRALIQRDPAYYKPKFGDDG